MDVAAKFVLILINLEIDLHPQVVFEINIYIEYKLKFMPSEGHTIKMKYRE